MTLKDNKALARIWFERVMNNHDLEALDETYSAEYIHRGPDGDVIRGRDHVRAVAERLITTVPNRVATVEAQIAEGDTVVTRWTSRGTAVSSLGQPGDEVIASGIVISRIAGGMIVEDWEIVHIERNPSS